jgi:hypothetical protein
MSSPRQQVIKQKLAYYANRPADPNAGKDPLERTDISDRLDVNIGDVPPVQYFENCCYPNSESVVINAPGTPVLDVVSGSALLSWTLNPENQNYFSVEKSLNGTSSFNQLNTTQNFNYTDTNVTRSNTYWYRVAGINQTGTGSYSNIANITFPDIPAGPITLNLFSGSAISQWTSSISNATSWALQRSINGVTYVNYATTTASIKTYTDTLVTASFSGSTYWYKVAAVNSWGTSSFSNTASITFTRPVPAAAPVLNVTSGSAILSWSYALNDEDGFGLQKSTDGVAYVPLTTVASPISRSYTDAAVSTPNTYWYKMYAYNAGGTGSFSNIASIEFTASVAPSNPTASCVQPPFQGSELSGSTPLAITI